MNQTMNINLWGIWDDGLKNVIFSQESKVADELKSAQIQMLDVQDQLAESQSKQTNSATRKSQLVNITLYRLLKSPENDA